MNNYDNSDFMYFVINIHSISAIDKKEERNED